MGAILSYFCQRWTTKENGYITSQFYSATKKRGADIYIGGTQDNGSFMSPFDGAPNSETVYQMVQGGDGFEVLWSYQNPDRAMDHTKPTSLEPCISPGL